MRKQFFGNSIYFSCGGRQFLSPDMQNIILPPIEVLNKYVFLIQSKIFEKYFSEHYVSFSCRGCQALLSDMRIINYSTVNNEGAGIFVSVTNSQKDIHTLRWNFLSMLFLYGVWHPCLFEQTPTVSKTICLHSKLWDIISDSSVNQVKEILVKVRSRKEKKVKALF